MRISKTDIVFLSGVVFASVMFVVGYPLIAPLGVAVAVGAFGTSVGRLVGRHKANRKMAADRRQAAIDANEADRIARGGLEDKPQFDS